MDPLHRVVWRRLELRDEVLEVRHELRIDRLDVAADDQPQARVAGGRHGVVLARPHQRHHLV